MCSIIRNVILIYFLTLFSSSFESPQSVIQKRSIIHSNSKKSGSIGIKNEFPTTPDQAPALEIEELNPAEPKESKNVNQELKESTTPPSASPPPESSKPKNKKPKTRHLQKPKNYEKILADAKKQEIQEGVEKIADETIQQGRAATNKQYLRWKDYIMLYKFDTIDSNWPSGARYEVEAAFETLQETMECFTFEEVLEDEYTYGLDYVLLKWMDDDNQCYSSLGKQGGEQELIMSSGCRNKYGVAMHEIMHTLGFYHEHVRPDRDEFVTVNKNLISDDYQSQYRIARYQEVFAKEYDFDSIMHYPFDSRKWLLPKKGKVKPGIKVGQRNHLSVNDKIRLKGIYPCDKAPF